jgi:hypothetical protein
MARDLYQGQPPPLGICLLHQRQVPRLLFPLFQGRRTRSTSELAGEGDSARLRTTEEPLPGHACSVQRLQADVPEHEQGRPEMSFSFACTVYYCIISPTLKSSRLKKGVPHLRTGHCMEFLFNLIHLWVGGALGVHVTIISSMNSIHFHDFHEVL